MTIDNEKIKDALDNFENDDFIRAKDEIKREIRGAVNDYFKDKLELKNDLEPNTETETDTDTDDSSDTDDNDDSSDSG